MIKSLLPTIFALLVGLTYYWSNKLNLKNENYYHHIISFSAGVSITYLLLELFPLFTEVALSTSKLMFVSVLCGFIVHHIIEKEIYQHNKKHELIKLLSLQENVFSFIYHIILGIVLVTFYQVSPIKGLLFFIAILTFTLVSTLPTMPHKSEKKAVLLSSSTLIGVLFATFVWTNRTEWIEFLFVGISIGVLLYTVIRHHIPFGRKGKLGFFTLGFLIYSLLIIGSWYI